MTGRVQGADDVVRRHYRRLAQLDGQGRCAEHEARHARLVERGGDPVVVHEEGTAGPVCKVGESRKVEESAAVCDAGEAAEDVDGDVVRGEGAIKVDEMLVPDVRAVRAWQAVAAEADCGVWMPLRAVEELGEERRGVIDVVVDSDNQSLRTRLHEQHRDELRRGAPVHRRPQQNDASFGSGGDERRGDVVGLALARGPVGHGNVDGVGVSCLLLEVAQLPRDEVDAPRQRREGDDDAHVFALWGVWPIGPRNRLGEFDAAAVRHAKRRRRAPEAVEVARSRVPPARRRPLPRRSARRRGASPPARRRLGGPLWAARRLRRSCGPRRGFAARPNRARYAVRRRRRLR
mmetsp:Transcript_17349/g.59479  ORF Transcript_17349/g.59479 Transcript_17349/m.59479 type:complete len:347 (-) Transcript_17349:386-1426(-)